MDTPLSVQSHTNLNDVTLSSSPPKTQTVKVKKKSLRKKSPPKLSIKQNLILEKLKLFYENKSNIKQLLDIINSNSKISLRIIDWFVTNYSKKQVITINNINLYTDYKLQLKGYSKKQFDPFVIENVLNFIIKTIVTIGDDLR